jgi:hypothetical protein
MAIFQVGKDFETAEKIGAVGTFQVDALLDNDDNDLVDRIDTGKHFHNDDDFKKYLSPILGIPINEIDLIDL